MPNLEDVVKKRLKDIRETLKLNQSQFADKIGISQAAISQFEDGKRVPSIESLDRIATALGMSVQSLLTDQTTDNNERQKLLQDIQAKLDVLNNEKLRAMNRFVSDWSGAGQKEDAK